MKADNQLLHIHKMNDVSHSFLQTNLTPKLHLSLMVSADDLNSRKE
jgi:hypothetical protein